jgi:hypothetical protein
MRYFALLNWQHVMVYGFPTLIFMVIFFLALGYRHFHSARGEDRQQRIVYTFAGRIQDRDAPFPLAMILIIAGALIWMVTYIVGTGVLEVRI